MTRIAADLVVGRGSSGVVDFGATITDVSSTGRADERVAYLCSGFVDLQVNGFDDVDVWRSGTERDHLAIDRVSQRLLDSGVTSWQPTLVTAPLERYEPVIEFLTSAQLTGSRSIGVHLEGPFLGRAPGAHRREAIIDVDDAFVSSLPSAVTMMTIAAESPGATNAIRELAAKGVRCSLGHSRPSRSEYVQARTAGAVSVTHLFNAMSGIDHREPGLATWALLDDSMFLGLIADSVHVHPDVLALAFRNALERIVLVSDSVGWNATPGVELRDGAPRLADGTLAGSALTLDSAVRHCVAAGVAPESALLAASRNPARLMGLHDRGLVAAGQRADLVGLDDDLNVVAVWLDGRRVR